VGTARIAEIAEFQLAPGMDVAEFKARAALSLAFLCATDGFIRRTLSMGEDGRWTDHVEWASLEQAQAALADARAELDQIRTALAAQQAQIATLTDEAAQAEAQAQLSAQAAMTRAAVTRIVTALDAGTGYTEALNDLTAANVEIPAALLEQAETGAPTLAALQADFPDLARDALRAVRQAQNPGGIGGFFETQLGLRSLQPREGDDPDAILSRAEAALRDGRLSETLDEIARLPEEAATVLADWQAQAQMRVTLTDAARSLAQSLNTN
jgi:hypothetical protein